MHLVSRAGWLFEMKEGAFLPIRNGRDPGNEVARLLVHMLIVPQNDE